jgi:hypothetical protein
MVIKRLVSPSTAAAFVAAAAAAGNWTDVMACVRGGGVALSHCPTLVADAAAASQAAIILECLLRCVDVLEADVACALTFALHSGTPAAFQALAHYIASAPSASASAAAPSAAAATKKSKGKSAEKSSGTGPSSGATTTGSGSVDAARRSLLHAALRARVSEVSMMPLLRAIPQRALVRLMRYLRSLMTNDAAAEANAVGGGKDCDALPSLQRVVEWTSMCMDAVGLQVSQRCGCARVLRLLTAALTRAHVTRLTLFDQLATTQEGREICASLKRAALVQQQAAVAMGSLHGVVQQARALTAPPPPPPPTHSPPPAVDGARENAGAGPTRTQHRPR